MKKYILILLMIPLFAQSQTWIVPGSSMLCPVKATFADSVIFSDSVVIGGTIPYAPLTVNGRIDIHSTGGSVLIGNGAGVKDDFTNNGNICIGQNAAPKVTTGQYNVAIGTNTLYDDNGSYNIGIGLFALRDADGGNYNVAIGANAMGESGDGSGNSYNVALGNNSLTNIFQGSGDYNLGLGASAFQNLRNGTQNIGIGTYAGQYATNGATNIFNGYRLVLIGDNTAPKYDSDTNEILIGSEVKGNGSNTATIGDDNITDVYLNENGTAKLHASTLATSGQIIDNSDSLIDANAVYDYADYNRQYYSFADSYIQNKIRDAITDTANVYATQAAYYIAKAKADNTWLNTSLMMIPYAGKSGVLYSVKGDNFDVSRSSTKSYIDEDGYIKQVGIDEPSIDFGSGFAALKVDPASTNKILFPFGYENPYWPKTGVSVELDASTADANIIGVSARGSGWIDNGDGTFTSDGSNGILTITGNFATNTSYYRKLAVSGLTTGSIYALYNGYSTEIPMMMVSANGEFYDYMKTPNTLTNTLVRIYTVNGFDGTIDLNNAFIKEVQAFNSPFKNSSGDIVKCARKIVENTSTGQHFITKGSLSISGGTYFTYSVIAKSGDRNFLDVSTFEQTSNIGREAYFDLTNGLVGSLSAGQTATITPLADGYYRCNVTIRTDASTTGVNAYAKIADTDHGSGIIPSYTGDGTSGIYIAGTQLEKQASATSIINDPEEVEGSEVSRASEDIGGATYTGNSESGVLFMESKVSDKSATDRFVSINNGANNNRIALGYSNGNDKIWALIYVNNVLQSNVSYTLSNSLDFNKIAVRWAKDDITLWVNGSKVATDTSADEFASGVLNNVDLRLHATSGYSLVNNIKQFAVDNYLTDAEMIELTTP